MSAIRVLTFGVLFLPAVPALAQSTVPASSADWIVHGEQSTRTFGFRVGSAGDVNGDGYGDVLIGDSGFDGPFTDRGRISLYLGSSTGLSLQPSWHLYRAASRFLAAGDVNGDGFDDFIIRDADGISLFHGSSGGPVPTSWMQDNLVPRGSGDVNGDGYADVATSFSNVTLQVFMGSASGLETVRSTNLTGGFGTSAVHDLNGDGYADLAYTRQGKLSVHLGSASGLQPEPSRAIDLPRNDEPRLLVAAGDVNGDGFGDLAAWNSGTPATTELVFVIYGKRNGIRPNPDTVSRPSNGAVVLEGLRGAGDVNGDGFDDLIVGEETGIDVSTHVVRVYRGGAQGISRTPSTIIQAELADDLFPTSPNGAGDVNGDGLGDIIVGAPHYLAIGLAYVFHGRPSL